MSWQLSICWVANCDYKQEESDIVSHALRLAIKLNYLYKVTRHKYSINACSTHHFHFLQDHGFFSEACVEMQGEYHRVYSEMLKHSLRCIHSMYLLTLFSGNRLWLLEQQPQPLQQLQWLPQQHLRLQQCLCPLADCLPGSL